MIAKNTHLFLYIYVNKEICRKYLLDLYWNKHSSLENGNVNLKTNITLTQSINQTKAATIWGQVCGAPTVYMELFDRAKGYL